MSDDAVDSLDALEQRAAACALERTEMAARLVSLQAEMAAATERHAECTALIAECRRSRKRERVCLHVAPARELAALLMDRIPYSEAPWRSAHGSDAALTRTAVQSSCPRDDHMHGGGVRCSSPLCETPDEELGTRCVWYAHLEHYCVVLCAVCFRDDVRARLGIESALGILPRRDAHVVIRYTMCENRITKRERLMPFSMCTCAPGDDARLEGVVDASVYAFAESAKIAPHGEAARAIVVNCLQFGGNRPEGDACDWVFPPYVEEDGVG